MDNFITNFKETSVKHFLNGLFFLIYFFSSSSLSAAYVSDYTDSTHQTKLYFNSNDFEISDHVIHIQLTNNLVETNVIRTDEQGLYFYENDIVRLTAGYGKSWKCPYCNRYWQVGDPCEYDKCPSKY